MTLFIAMRIKQIIPAILSAFSFPAYITRIIPNTTPKPKILDTQITVSCNEVLINVANDMDVTPPTEMMYFQTVSFAKK